MSLRDIMGEIDVAYGAGMVAQASRGSSFKTKRFPTLMFDFDLAIGGGIPWKRFIQIFGPESGGKSVLMTKITAAAQLNCRYCRGRFVPDEHGEALCLCAPDCPDCKKPYVATEYDGPPALDTDPFDWEAIHDEWICECLVNAPGSKLKKDRVQKVIRRAAPIRTAIFDAENSFDERWATHLGVDTRLVFVFVPEYAEQGIDIADKLLRSGEIDILAVDSIAELTPGKEIEASTEEWQMGLQARLVNKALRKWNSSINALGACAEMCPVVILINQVRANLGGYEDVCPGGAGQKYKSAIRVRVNAAKYSFKEHGSGESKVKELQFVDISGFTKKNKCVAGDTAIYLPDTAEIACVGEMAELERIQVLGWDGSSVVQDEAAGCEEQRLDEIIKLSVSGVGEFRANAEHPVMVGDMQWTRMDDVKVGDVVPVPYTTIPEDSSLYKTEARLLGLLTGDGWVGGTTGVSLTSDSSRIVAKFAEAVEPFDCEVYPKDDLHWVVRNKDGGHRGKPNKLYGFLRENGLWGKRSWDKVVPPAVFRASDASKVAFLEGLIATDGYVAQGHHRIGITTVSRKLAEGLRVLYSSLRLRASVISRVPRSGENSFKGTRATYEVRVGGHHAQSLREMVQWLGGKGTKFSTWPKRIEDPIVPAEWARVMIEEAKAQGYVAKSFALEMGFSETGWDELLRIRGKKASRTRAEALQKYAQLEAGRALDLPVDFAIVTKIEADGEEMVYDICGTSTESFVAQGLIVHNTYPPMKRFSMRLYLDDFDGHPAGSMNEFSCVSARAMEFGIILRPSKTTYTYTDDTYAMSWSSQKQIIEDMQADQALFWAIRESTLAVALETVR